MKTSPLHTPLSLALLLLAAGTAWASPPAAPAARTATSATASSVVFVAARKAAPKLAAAPAAVAAPRVSAGEPVSADGDRFRYDSCGCLGS